MAAAEASAAAALEGEPTGELGAAAANAEIDYAGVGYLGGAKQIDVNNANIRAYIKLPGMYPTVAGKMLKALPPVTIRQKGGFKNYDDMLKLVAFDDKEKAVVEKYKYNSAQWRTIYANGHVTCESEC